jgi:hypothetical protein
MLPFKEKYLPMTSPSHEKYHKEVLGEECF